MRGSFPTVQLEQREFERLRRLIHEETGISLAPSKRVLLESRLARRLRALQLDSFAAYCAHLDAHLDDERVPLINCVTTNKTEFFREAHHFEFLRSHALPAIEARAARTGQRRLRIWSAGCSTGEEPYSLALTLLEWLEQRPGWDVRLLASDIDTNVLEAASRAHYPDERLEDVPLPWRRRWFRALPGRPGWSEADPALRALIAFRRINLNDQPWPIRTTFDLILCRNVIIYFNRTTQTRLLERFAGLLEPDGHLIIGHSESLAWLSDTFTAVRGQPTVYTLASRQARGERAAPSSPPAPSAATAAAAAAAGATATTGASAIASAGASASVAAYRTASASSTVAGHAIARARGSVPAGATHAPRPLTPARSGVDAGALASVDAHAAVPRTLALGEMRVSADGGVLRLLLESAAGVAIFDPEARAGGLLSLLLPPLPPLPPPTLSALSSSPPPPPPPSPSPSRSSSPPSPPLLPAVEAERASLSLQQDTGADTSVAGERALASLIAATIEAGGRRERLRAKLFGGASRPGETTAPDAASRTLACVRRLLEREAVPVVSERTGGETPIELLFHTDSGRARVRDLALAERAGVTARGLAVIDLLATDLPATCRGIEHALADDVNVRVSATDMAASMGVGMDAGMAAVRGAAEEPLPRVRTGAAD